MDTKQREAVIQIVHKLKEMDVDGETLQYIIRGLGMEDQMLRQLVMTLPLKQTLDLILEKEELV
jgi:PII-like signaling protein